MIFKRAKSVFLIIVTALNGLEAGKSIQAGQRVKIVVEG